MTVILASLAMDRWHGLFLSRRMNTSCTVCCVSSSPLYQQRDIERKKTKTKEYGIWVRAYLLFAEPCWSMPDSREWQQPPGMPHCSFDFSFISRGPQLHACPLVEAVLFSGEGISPESSMYFPRNTGVHQDYMFSLEGN